MSGVRRITREDQLPNWWDDPIVRSTVYKVTTCPDCGAPAIAFAHYRNEAPPSWSILENRGGWKVAAIAWWDGLTLCALPVPPEEDTPPAALTRMAQRAWAANQAQRQ